ncbi:MBL fold metallo-hydrolase (plasmid) [Streptomyces sp. BI20]|uniref:MBL fold metallo-hydrolase n=1 Tax=Streptomyces sp. BI20 TaxID=3403460 RepID=UPI003C763F13
MTRATIRRAATAGVAATASVALLSACGGAAADTAQAGPTGSTPPSASAPAATPTAPAATPAGDLAVTHVGGPTTILEIGGARLLLDPTFDAPKKYESGLEKTKAPAFGTDKLGRVDAVLLSHDQHDDNLDDSGRALLKEVPTVYSTPGARGRLGEHVTGLKPWESRDLKTPTGTLKVTAVPALHGPDGVDRGEDGEVTGFVLSGTGVPVTYVSGDNASVKVAGELAARVAKEIGPIDTVVLFAGAARTPAILDNAPLTLTSRNAALVAKNINPRKVVPVHTDSWNIYSEDMNSLVKAFEAQGIADRLVLPTPDGTRKPVN